MHRQTGTNIANRHRHADRERPTHTQIYRQTEQLSERDSETGKDRDIMRRWNKEIGKQSC